MTLRLCVSSLAYSDVKAEPTYISHKNSKMASKVVPDAVPAADDPPGDTDDLSKSSPDSKTVGSTGESNPSTEPEATESTAPSELSSEDRPRRPTAN